MILHEHGHGAGQRASHRGRLMTVLIITTVVLIVEVIGATVSGSLALLADAGHMLTDVAGLTLAWFASVLAQRPATLARTWGYRRAEVLAAVGQAAVLLAVGGFVLVEGIRRLIEPPEVASLAMVIFGVIGLVGNSIGIAVLAGARSGEPQHAGRVPGSRQRRSRLPRRAHRRRRHSRPPAGRARTRWRRCSSGR